MKNDYIEICLSEGHEVHKCSICGVPWCGTCGCQIHDHDEDELVVSLNSYPLRKRIFLKLTGLDITDDEREFIARKIEEAVRDWLKERLDEVVSE